MVLEAPSDNALSHAIASESASAASDEGEETKSSQASKRRGTQGMDIEVGNLNSHSENESEISPSMRVSNKPDNTSTFYNNKYGAGESKGGSD